MGVKIKFWKGAWWVFVNHQGRRKAKRIGDKETVQHVAKAIRERMARGDLNLIRLRMRKRSRRTRRAGYHGQRQSQGEYYHVYRAPGAHILPALGDPSVSSIVRRDCRELVATCRGQGPGAGECARHRPHAEHDSQSGRRG
jgi:hypothetical protein